jgi:hypothetical protein
MPRSDIWGMLARTSQPTFRLRQDTKDAKIGETEKLVGEG